MERELDFYNSLRNLLHPDDLERLDEYYRLREEELKRLEESGLLPPKNTGLPEKTERELLEACGLIGIWVETKSPEE